MNYSNCFLSEIISSNKESIFIDYYSINVNQSNNSKSIKSIINVNQTIINENNVENDKKIGISQEKQGKTMIFIENSEKTQIKNMFLYLNQLIFFDFSSFDLKNFTHLRKVYKNIKSTTKIRFLPLNPSLFLLILMKKPVFSIFLIFFQQTQSLDCYIIKKEVYSFSSLLYKDIYNIEVKMNNDYSYTINLLIVLNNTNVKTVFFTFEYLFESTQRKDLLIKIVSSSFQDEEDEDEAKEEEDNEEDNLIVKYPYIINNNNNQYTSIYKYSQDTQSKLEIIKLNLLDKETLFSIHQLKNELYCFSSLEVTNTKEIIYKSLEIKIYKCKPLSQIIELEYKIQYNLLLDKEYSIKLINESTISDYIYFTIHIHSIGVYLHSLFIDNSNKDTDPCLVLERIYYIQGNSISKDVLSIEDSCFLYYDIEKDEVLSLDILNCEYLDCLVLQSNTNLKEKFIEELNLDHDLLSNCCQVSKTEYLNMKNQTENENDNENQTRKVIEAFKERYFQFEKKLFQNELLISTINKEILMEKEKNQKLFKEISEILSGFVEKSQKFMVLNKKRRGIKMKIKKMEDN